jgi:hypothetical protein
MLSQCPYARRESRKENAITRTRGAEKEGARVRVRVCERERERESLNHGKTKSLTQKWRKPVQITSKNGGKERKNERKERKEDGAKEKETLGSADSLGRRGNPRMFRRAWGKKKL